MDIYYDNFCSKCTLFIKIIKKLDWLNLIKIKQLRNKEHIDTAMGINHILAEQQMASYNGNKWSYGYLTLFKIFIRLPIFWIFFPALFILKVTGLGQFFYLKLAVNRNIIPIHCKENNCKLNSTK